MARIRATLDSIRVELDKLQKYNELAISRAELPEGAGSFLRLDPEKLRDKDIVRFKISAAISERERLDTSLRFQLQTLEDSMKAMSKCPECNGTGRILERKSYERLEEGRIIETRDELECDLCHGKGFLDVGDTVRGSSSSGQ